MKLIRRAFSAFGRFLKGMFYGPGNTDPDVGRIMGTLAVCSMFAAAGWNVSLGLPIELGPTGFGGGLAAVCGGVAAWIYAKDRAKAENTVAKAVVAAAPPKP